MNFFGYNGLVGQTSAVIPGLTSAGMKLGAGYEDMAAVIFNVTRHNRADVDRYSTDHKRIIPTDSILVKRSPALAVARFDPYIYQSLVFSSESSALTEIRLLKLHPLAGTASDDPASDFLHCELFSAELSRASSLGYEALSYTWGRSPRSVPILMVPSAPADLNMDMPGDKTGLDVTPQLFAALRRLRLPNDMRYLWVDQLCINQDDLEERNQQVQLMADVYRNAKQTVVWLGEEDRGKDDIEELAVYLVSTKGASSSDDKEILKGLIDVSKSGSSGDKAGQRRREAVTQLLNRDWFTRAWVYQEVVLSKDIQIRYGSLEMSFETFKRLVEAVFSIEYAAGGYARSLVKTTVGFETMDLIKHGRKECHYPDCHKQSRQSFLQVLLDGLQHFTATNPRDLIYAFLAFADPACTARIVPDYKAPVESVWTNAAKCIIKGSRSLDIFAAAPGDARRSMKLPSWVPDWEWPYKHARPITAPDLKTSFNACNGRHHIFEDSDESDSLSVKGKVIGSIAWFSPHNFQTSYYREGLRPFLKFAEHMGMINRYLGSVRGIANWGDAAFQGRLELTLMRTILADGAFGDIQPLPYPVEEILDAYKNEETIENPIISLFAPGASPNLLAKRREILEKLREWSLVAQMKQLFLAQDLSLGLAPRTTAVGDLICIIHGSRVPCILRPVEDDVGRRYRVMSQCYLDGWMYGELPSGSWWNEEEADTFILV